MASSPRRPLTVEEYIALEQKAECKSEYFLGDVFVLPNASPAHSLIQGNLAGSLFPQTTRSGCRAYSSSLRILVEATGLFTYADTSIVSGQLQVGPGLSATNPKVIFEVISPSTRRHDHIGKFAHYRQIPSLEEYVLIEQQSVSVDRRRRLPNGEWEFTRLNGEDAVLELTSVSLSIPLRQIYSEVEFEHADRDPEEP